MKNYEIRPYPIRMPVEMREQLEAAAKAANRSLHAEIMMRLEESLGDENLKLKTFTAITEGGLVKIDKEEYFRRLQQVSSELGALISQLIASQDKPLTLEELDELEAEANKRTQSN